MHVCQLTVCISQKPCFHQTSWNFFSCCCSFAGDNVMYFRFVDDVMFTHIMGHIRQITAVIIVTAMGLAKEAWARRLYWERSLVCPNCLLFTARCYASAVLAMGLHVSVCLSACLCLSVTSRCSTKTAKRRITQTTPHDTPETLVFWYQRSQRNSTGVTPYGGAECRWGGSKSATFDKYRLYLENGTR